jgi:hypothetical protein
MIAAGKLPSDVPPDFGYVTDAAQKKAQEQLANLVPNAKHITNTNSGHEIHKEQPQLVIDAIRRSSRRFVATTVSSRVGFGPCASDMSSCHCLVESKTADCLLIMHHYD